MLNLRRWWNRECGGREVMAIAWPMVISTGAFALLLFIDRMFLFWYSADAMAAAMPAGMLYWSALCLPLGIAQYVSTFVAQYHGARRPDRIGSAVWQGCRFGLYTIPCYIAVIPLAPAVFGRMGHTPVIQWQEALYFQTLMWGAGAAILSTSMSAFYTGRGQTRVVMYVNIGATVLNIALDAWLIFGGWGLPALGIEGAAWATVAAEWSKVAWYAVLIYRPHNIHTYQLAAGRAIDLALFRRLMIYGTPAGLQMLAEGSAFTVAIVMIGQFGETALAATSLALNVNAVAFVPMLGLGVAVSVLVGQQVSGRRADLAARATWTAMILGLAYSTAFAAAYVLAPRAFLLAYGAGVSPESFLEVESLAVVLLRFVAAYCLFDTAQIVFVGAIKGAGDTWFVLLATVLVAAAALAAGIVWDDARGVLWWWLVITVWILALAVIYALRFWLGPWKQMRVIEETGESSAGELDGKAPELCSASAPPLSPARAARGSTWTR